MDILSTQTVLGTILHETRTGIYHEDALAVLRFFLIDNNDTCRDASTVEKVGWQANDALDVSFAYQIVANISLCIATEQHTMWQNASTFTSALKRADNVQ